jgi:hypothetical protein
MCRVQALYNSNHSNYILNLCIELTSCLTWCSEWLKDANVTSITGPKYHTLGLPIHYLHAIRGVLSVFHFKALPDIYQLLVSLSPFRIVHLHQLHLHSCRVLNILLRHDKRHRGCPLNNTLIYTERNRSRYLDSSVRNNKTDKLTGSWTNAETDKSGSCAFPQYFSPTTRH